MAKLPRRALVWSGLNHISQYKDRFTGRTATETAPLGSGTVGRVVETELCGHASAQTSQRSIDFAKSTAEEEKEASTMQVDLQAPRPQGARHHLAARRPCRA